MVTDLWDGSNQVHCLPQRTLLHNHINFFHPPPTSLSETPNSNDMNTTHHLHIISYIANQKDPFWYTVLNRIENAIVEAS